MANSKRKYCGYLIIVALFIFLLFCTNSVVSAATLSPSSGSPGEDKAVGADKVIFTDLADTSPLYPYVRYLADKGIIKGFPDGTFRPAEAVTRAQAAKVMVLAKGLQPTSGNLPTFNDVPSEHWAFAEIEAATKAGLIKGYPDGTFAPDSVITRAEAITLLLRLSEGALSNKSITIGDVNREHWAYRQVVTAVEAGLVELSSDKLFEPDQAFSRGDLVKGLSAMYTLSPVLRQADLTAKLTKKKGQVTLGDINGNSRLLKGETIIGNGAKITTGDQSQAEITFDDGSGILIDANTELHITEAKGFAYVRRDGSQGVAVEKLIINLKRGKIFGALASRYENVGQPASDRKTTYINGDLVKYITLASANLSQGLVGMLLAENEASATGNEETAWWNEPYAERERVVVDMPWGIAAIRGTFWMNEVGSSGQATSLITGHATVTANGQTVSLTAGQATVITTPAAPPAPPAALTQTESQAWAIVKDFVTERAQQIQENIAIPAPVILLPQIPVEQPVEQQQQEQQHQQNEQTISNQQQTTDIVNFIIQSFQNATSGVGTIVTSPTISTSSQGNSGNNTGNTTEIAELPSGVLTENLVKTFGSGNVCITIPAGITLPESSEITVKAMSEPPAQPSGAQLAGQMADIKITGLPQGTSIPIRLKAVSGTNNPAIYYYNPNTVKWEYQSGTLDQTTWFVTAMVNHFSIYAVLNDNTAPIVMGSEPVNNATDIPLDKTITVTFSEDVTEGDNYNNITLKDANNSPINISKSISGSVLTITPLIPLSPGITYAVSVTAGAVKDLAGNPLAADYNFSFITGAAPDTTPPTVSTTSPADNQTDVPVNTAITVAFSEHAQAGGNYSSGICLKDGATVVNVTYSISGNVLTITPVAPLDYSVRYAVYVAAGAVKDLAGNPLAADYNFGFTTGAAPDTTPPTVSTTSPADNQTDVPVSTAITVAFSEPVRASTSFSSVKLKCEEVETVITEVYFEPSNPADLIIYPVNGLDYGKTYELYIPSTAVEDLSGNVCLQSKTIRFTTVSNGEIRGQAKLSDVAVDYSGINIIVSGYTVKGEFVEYTTATDSDGSFTFTMIPDGNYVLEARKTGYCPTNAIIGVADGQTVTLDMIMILYPEVATGIVEGYAKFIDNSDHKGIGIKVQTLEGDLLPDMVAITDSQGHFEFDAVPVKDKETGQSNYIFTAFSMDDAAKYSTDSVQATVYKNGTTLIPQTLWLRPSSSELIIFADQTTIWGQNAFQEKVNALGVPYSLYGSENMNTVPLPVNKTVWILADQPQSFYNAYAANQNRFSDFVKQGGTLLFEACDMGWDNGSIAAAGASLPGGVLNSQRYDVYNRNVNPTHPMMNGVSIDLNGNYASHNYFENLPVNSTILCVDSLNNPTLVEYKYELGRVVATGQPLEYYWGSNNGLCQIYNNMIEYTFNLK